MSHGQLFKTREDLVQVSCDGRPFVCFLVRFPGPAGRGRRRVYGETGRVFVVGATGVVVIPAGPLKKPSGF